MYTTYHLQSAQEISNDLIESIKANFKSKPITITVTGELDATDYLLSSPANKAILEKSLEQAKKGEFVELKIDNL